MEKIIETLDKLMKPFRDFMSEYGNNPIIWVILLGLGLIVFKLVYQALQKER